jgi:hypothetical protein
MRKIVLHGLNITDFSAPPEDILVKHMGATPDAQRISVMSRTTGHTTWCADRTSRVCALMLLTAGWSSP